jgi:hypothetical protein
MRIMPRRDGLTMLLLVVLVLGGVAIGQQDAGARIPPVERLGFNSVGGQVAVVAPRVSGWQELVDQLDERLPRGLWPAVAGLLVMLLSRLAAIGRLVRSSAPWGRPGHAGAVAGQRAPPGSVQLA